MRFFFYGTLTHEQTNSIAAAVRDSLIQPRRAYVRGALYAIESARGWYPALDPRKAGRVWGFAYTAGPGFGRETLALLDRYENYYPRNPRQSDYLRRRIALRLAGGGRMLAHAYLWNRPVSRSMRPVPHGDFTRFLAEQGLPVLWSGLED